VQTALAIGELLEACELSRFERERGELLRRLAELVTHARVILEQRRVLEDQLLTGDALERGRLLEELPAHASRSGGLQHLFAALRCESIEREDGLRERVDQRQAHQQKAEQDELEE